MPSRRSLTHLIPAVLTLLPALAWADGVVQVYGIGDLAVTAQGNRATAAGTSGSATVVPAGAGTAVAATSGAWQTSRIGVRGKLPLMDDLSAVYDVCSTLNLTSGAFANSNRLFDRNAFFGLTSDTYGTLTFGRQGTSLAESLWVTDPLRVNAGATNMNVRLGYMAGPGATLVNAFGVTPQNNSNGVALDRQDASLKYTYKKAGFTGMVVYAFGGVAGTAATNSSGGAMLGYDGGPITVRVAAAEFQDAKGITLYGLTGGAVGTFGTLKVRATFTETKVDDDATYGGLKTDVWALGATYALLPRLDLTAAYYGAQRTQLNQADQRADKIYLVPEFSVAKQFLLYGIIDYELFNSAGSALDTGTALQGGVSNSLYVGVGMSYSFSS